MLLSYLKQIIKFFLLDAMLGKFMTQSFGNNLLMHNLGTPKKPLFSIIIPTYNSWSTIHACLQSIAIQNFKDFEVLILDNLSNDQTPAVVKEFNSKFLLYFFTQKDEGIYDAMNKGIARAKGEYLYFLGSDDTLFSNETLQIVANEIAVSQAKIIYGNVKMQGNSQLVNDGSIYGGEFDLKRLLEHNIPHQAIFYHESIFKHLDHYNIKYPLFADHDLNLRATSVYSFYYIPQIIANFTVGGSSTLLVDEQFKKDKIRNFVNYFSSKIHSKKFISLRYYIKEAAFNGNHKVSPILRAYCVLIYSKLKFQSLFH
ncbi:MAG: glycosyltransferase [Pedobacter sp.]|nr:MAG: glycosyltransferase [Pedobacter sp.]